MLYVNVVAFLYDCFFSWTTPIETEINCDLSARVLGVAEAVF